ncbi:MAG: hypothetical protein A2Z83_05360 [Omnitrophica bacterium GWA2_52_8]|nr:MAG: hypothetical protein A2Z83_05360 [Omnitrophica bacterium GWA2_52_8]
MPQQNLFIHKVLNRLDKIDPAQVRQYVTELHHTASQLADIIEAVHEGILLMDRTGQIKFYNRQAALWLQIPDAPHRTLSIHNPIFDAQLSRILSHSLNTSTVAQSDISLLTPRELTFRVSISPMTNFNDWLLITLEDMTAEKSSLQLYEQLARTESLMKLSAGIAHDIGNPLNSIGIHLQLLRQDIASLSAADKKKIASKISVIESETARLDKIIKDFLKATRKHPLRVKNENLNRVVEEALRFMRPELLEGNIQALVTRDDKLSPFLFDPDRIYQCCLNLIKNALEAMPKGGRLDIVVSHKNKIASISFKDTGVGIRDDVLPHIFEPYFTTKKEGSGLGLMTVFNIIQEHGGRIDVQSKAAKGTDITLILPMRQPKLQLPTPQSRPV